MCPLVKCMHQAPGEHTYSSKIKWTFNLCTELDCKAPVGSVGKVLIRNVPYRLESRLELGRSGCHFYCLLSKQCHHFRCAYADSINGAKDWFSWIICFPFWGAICLDIRRIHRQNIRE